MGTAETPSLDSVIFVTDISSPTEGFLVHSVSQNSDPTSLATIQQTRNSNASPELLEQYLFRGLPAYLNLPAEDLHIIISTNSGTGKAEAYFESILKPVLQSIGLGDDSYNVMRTTSNESVKKFAVGRLLKRAQSGVEQTVILLSGDGGIVDILNGLLGGEKLSSQFKRPNVALFPLGTGNALFHSLHRSQQTPPIETDDITLALRDLLIGSHQPLPIFRATFSPGSRVLSDEGRAAQPVPGNALYGAVVASYGFHATLVADSDTEEWRKKGSERFGMVAKELLFPADGGQPYAYKARVALLSQESQRLEPVQSLEHEYVLVTMVSNLERTFTISPLSRPLDGTMRVVHFGPGPGAKIMKIMQLAYQGGKHVGEGLDLVSYEEIDGLRLDMLEVGEDGRWRRVCIDGMIVRIEEGGWMEVRKLPKADSVINVIIRPVK